MKIVETSMCEICSSNLPSNGTADVMATGDSHSCLQSIMRCIRKNSDTIRDQEETISSQNILLAKLIRELEEVREQVRSQCKEISSLKEDLDKVKLTQASIVVEPEHKSLIDKLKTDGLIKSDKVYQIMLSVDFRDFNQDNVTPNKR
jgi:hypothetical protein